MNLSFITVCFGFRVVDRARLRGACHFSHGWTAPPEQPNLLSVAAFDQFGQLKSLRSEDSKKFYTERLCSQRISDHSFTWKCSNVSACFSMEEKRFPLLRIIGPFICIILQKSETASSLNKPGITMHALYSGLWCHLSGCMVHHCLLLRINFVCDQVLCAILTGATVWAAFAISNSGVGTGDDRAGDPATDGRRILQECTHTKHVSLALNQSIGGWFYHTNVSYVHAY